MVGITVHSPKKTCTYPLGCAKRIDSLLPCRAELYEAAQAYNQEAFQFKHLQKLFERN
jgi:hypothetical protein